MDLNKHLWKIAIGTWAITGALGAKASEAALNSMSSATRIGVLISLGVIWTVGSFSIAIPHQVFLTAWRMLSPTVIVIAAWMTIFPESQSVIQIATVGFAILTVLLVNSADFADRAINGLAYANEKRFLLRTPAGLSVGPLAVLGCLPPMATIAAVVFFLNQNWLAAVVVSILAFVGWARITPSIYRLANRWFVIVPSGFVIRDPLLLEDAVLINKRELKSLSPALSTSSSLDLTEGAFGLALQAELIDSTLLIRRDIRKRRSEAVHAHSFLISPIRAGNALLTYRQTHDRRATPPPSTSKSSQS